MPYQQKPSHSQFAPHGEALAKPVDRLEDDATGINVEDRKPIDPRMPHMPPA
jgi:hypothetical protein